jgi:hypothetical protein
LRAKKKVFVSEVPPPPHPFNLAVNALYPPLPKIFKFDVLPTATDRCRR